MTSWQDAENAKYVVLPGGEGTPLTVFGNRFSLKVGGDDTAGSLAIIEATFAPGTRAPPHLHHTHTESFYVVSGLFRFRAGDELTEVGPGGFRYLPRKAAHGFTNIGDEPGKLLSVINPAGYERHFEEISALLPHEATEERLREIFQRYDQEPA
ncbi:cupin domain-containing protein [Kitasatospora sp. NPDC087861]|uniref:cupin domain-containing protein n=1 Tax=Kitasatospora sp. NPDC087861 TaxID=3364070 RepID=UPI00382302DE